MSDIGWDPLRFFAEGGWAMYLIAFVAIFGHVLAVVALASVVSKRRTIPLAFGAVSLLFSVSTACLGVGGYLLGMQNVEEAIAYADPSMQAELRQQGADEADNNLFFGGCAFLFPLVAGLVALGRGATLKDGPPTA